MAKAFASQGDMADKEISFTEVGDGLYAFTAEGDPNSGVIIGDDSVMIVEAQATPRLARKVIECVRSVTDKPISHLVLTHYHAVRVLGASAFEAPQVIMSEKARAMVVERGQEDWDSEFDRFPRLFQGHEEIPGLTWPTTTFNGRMSVYLGERRIDIMQLGRAHTAGDAVIYVPDQNVMFTGDIVEYHSACYCGDGHFHDWPVTLEAIRRFDLDAIAPGRGDALVGKDMVNAALDATADFVRSTYRPAAQVALRGGSLKDAWDAVRAECDPKFSDYAIYEHCLPFNVARAYDEARDIDTPRIWTAQRDKDMWEALQG
ncbi:MBL fold metallo-hydrolase [Ponticoccus sp. SC2-23]|uniref:MBL fold metallo-hydrolase n=1 Tax=Alexandriicola marinus TaxID=2081710 RepID=UPI000FDC43B4|nr:MBL fold metallo-hydrolase [Alexandriicola marinus]MBM1220430.1 MBL fold metallo-hydrolase [Ponticoccus sp. SC6-9]MBM1225116.1 MBL fold metallo-hydrolase [Ponticoccus sp. SC6-15]MBM1228630.1 MBL fold metallo-hydrolase [Ponticoccus sp. SC6-38]MBM1233733.1 MBL fold metallo-hydrolase [Ponticoccus sp. SC6-45]MBM1239131.1 MBL fold metallo-hydrolase [Ponticoccus sp. SC6-49]MBM1242913.1 MBL fold metallo-hydrolase [Ponticoccus sp. SC2-64]MBM1247257.1 MBL fold metallo-hydrolase [Ponticoccus sp. SC